MSVRDKPARGAAPVNPAAAAVRAKATVTMEPVGHRGDSPRAFQIRAVLELGTSGITDAAAIVRRALGAYAPADGAVDQRELRDVVEAGRAKQGVPTSTKVGIEARVTCVERPSDAVIEALRTSLTENGFRTFLRERRECAEAGCFTDAMLDWSRPDEVPRGWFSSTICGSHDYRQCPPCRSIYRLSNSNAAGQATAVHCEVCGRVLVEWGSSKIWEAELVVRGALVPGRR